MGKISLNVIKDFTVLLLGVITCKYGFVFVRNNSFCCGEEFDWENILTYFIIYIIKIYNNYKVEWIAI